MQPILKPFRGTYYNPALVSNISKVVCPPYDVIDSERLAALGTKSPYNFSHILIAGDGNYRPTGKTLRRWLDERILIDDLREGVYLYEQRFNCEGRMYRRFGIIALLQMDKKEFVFPHEYTLQKPKEDRAKIIREAKANLSPIFVIVPQTLQTFSRIYSGYVRKKPFLRFKDFDGHINAVWKIEHKGYIAQICREVAKYKLVIADGHHRFEVAYNYYKRNATRFKDLNYILAYITDIRKGLLILPTHRIVRIRDNFRTLFSRLADYFHIEETNSQDCEERLRESGIFSFGLYWDNTFYFLCLRNHCILDTIVTDKIYHKVDTYVLHQVVFSLCAIEGQIEYTHSFKDAQRLAQGGKVAFLLRPLPLDIICKLANSGYRLPQKSTYFYPKILSGIVLRRFERK